MADDNNLTKFLMDIFPDQKECDQVIMELTSDDVSATTVEDLKFLDWRCVVGKLTVKQRNTISKKIKEITTNQRRQTQVLNMTGNKIKMNLFKPPKFKYSMDYRYWTVEMTSEFLMQSGVPKTAAYAVKDLDGIKLLNLDESKLGWFEGFRLKGDTMKKINHAKDLCRKEFAATVITRAARVFEFRKMNKLYAYRTNVAQELLSTEENYVEQLQVLVTNIVEPQLQQNALLTPEQTKKIFSDIQMILSVNKQFLESFQTIIRHWTSESKIGGLFIKLAPFLKIYGEYCKNYPEALKALKELGPTHPFYEFYSTTIREKAPDDYKNFEVASFLITPIQRIPRYKLLLNDLLKHTPSTHPDFKELSDGFNIVSEVAISVNETSRQHEYMDKVNELSEKIMELPRDVNLQIPGRIYQKDGVGYSFFKKKFVPTHIILFTDVLIFCEYKESLISKSLSKKVTYKMHLNVLDLVISDPIPDEIPKIKDITPESIIKIVGGKKTVLVSFKKQGDKDDWKNKLESTITTSIERKKLFEDKAIDASKQKAEVAKNMLDVKYSSLKNSTARKWSERGKSVAQMTAVEKWRLAQEAKQSMLETSSHSRKNSSFDLTASTPIGTSEVVLPESITMSKSTHTKSKPSANKSPRSKK
ncbi:Rho guanine nucleotide exchange factor [Entamoeba marina]